MHIRNATVITQANALATDVDSGVGAAICNIYSGSVPTDADTALGAQVLLAAITLNDPAFATAVDASPGARLDLDVTPQPSTSSAAATGTASFARIVESGGTTIVQLDTVTATGGGGELEINNVAIQSGTTVTITAGSLTTPES